jgi:chromosomal replication initiator protein
VVLDNPDRGDSIRQPRDGVEHDPHTVWQMVLGELALQMQSATFDTWVRDTHVIAYEDGEFIIGMPNPYARDWLENRLRNQIKRTLRSIMRRTIQVQFQVCLPKLEGDTEDAPLYSRSLIEAEVEEVEKPANVPPTTPTRVAVSTPRHISQVNAQHTFESFVVGNHNRLAHAAAAAIADHPGQSFNPLFVYGGVGLGKTHLLHAIGNRTQERGYQMLYCSSEQFTNELISAIRNRSTEEFRSKYRQVDILLIDDIQFIGGKESTQEEFFHTFNHLHANGGQVVLSSDRPPRALATLEERLRSRFEGGLQTDISQPDFETRVAILQTKATKMGIPVEQDVLMLVAERVESNVRELEGALNRLILQAQLSSSRLNYSLALTILDNLAPRRTPCTPDRIIAIVADYFDLLVDDLTGRKRTKAIASARQIAMYLLREESALSLPVIGGHLGGRDHSTVRYGVEKITGELTEDTTLRQEVMKLRDLIYAP